MPSSRRAPRIGTRYSRWVIASVTIERRGRALFYDCRCDCGTRVMLNSDNLIRGLSQSCGCLQRDNVAEGKRLYADVKQLRSLWRAIKNRCNNPTDAGYANYGGRGIRVCDAWLVFENFLRDVGTRPEPGLTIERKDVNGNYEPGNVEWKTYHVQSRNRTNNRWHEFNGERHLLVDWAAKMNMPYRTLVSRFYVYKWPIERVLTTPIRTH